MSTSVDVFAVLDREVTRAGGESYPDGRDLIAARAAVAELIEAVEEARRSESFDSDIESWVQYSLRFRANKDRLWAALARVKGA